MLWYGDDVVIPSDRGVRSGSKTGDVSRTVASLVSHLRTKENCDILKDDEKYYLIGMKTKDGWVAEPWVETRMSRE